MPRGGYEARTYVKGKHQLIPRKKVMAFEWVKMTTHAGSASQTTVGYWFNYMINNLDDMSGGASDPPYNFGFWCGASGQYLKYRALKAEWQVIIESLGSAVNCSDMYVIHTDEATGAHASETLQTVCRNPYVMCRNLRGKIGGNSGIIRASGKVNIVKWIGRVFGKEVAEQVTVSTAAPAQPLYFSVGYVNSLGTTTIQPVNITVKFRVLVELTQPNIG